MSFRHACIHLPYGYDIKVIHSECAISFINQQSIQYHTISPYQHEQKLERCVQTMPDLDQCYQVSNVNFRMNYICTIIFAIVKSLNILPNSVHPTLNPSIIFLGYKIDVNTQDPIPFGKFAAIHYDKRFINKFEPHTKNGLILYLANNVVAWIPGRNTVTAINKYTIIKAPSDFGFQDNTNIIRSRTPDFRTISPRP